MSDNTFLDKVKAGHPIQTRDGRPARFVVHIPDGDEEARLVAVISADNVRHGENGNTFTALYYEDGRMNEKPGSPYDLILAPKPKVKRGGGWR